jgi:hypothetical protein
LAAIYTSQASRIVLRCSRQCEKSTLLAIMAILEVATNPHAVVLIVQPRDEQLRSFRDTYLLPMLKKSPILCRMLFGRHSKVSAHFIQLENGARIFLRSSFHNADAARGISATLLLVDEFQDDAPGCLPILEQCLSHAPRKRVIVAGTPRSSDNQLEVLFQQTTVKEWVARCAQCGHPNTPVEETLGPDALQCVKCRAPIDFRNGGWVARKPDAKGGDGFWVNHLMGPWRNHADLLQWQREYSLPAFHNEVIGLPVDVGEHLVTQAEVEACCSNRPMPACRDAAAGLRLIPETLVLGVDWGGGENTRTAFVVGAHDEEQDFHVLYMERLPLTVDFSRAVVRAAELIANFNVTWVAADGQGHGAVLNRNLLDVITPRRARPGFFSMRYADTEQRPERKDDVQWNWTLDRTRTLADVFTRVQRKRITLPALQHCGPLLEEIWHEAANFDPEGRTLRFSCPAGGNDDVLHSLAYCLRLSKYLLGSPYLIG